jgi:hypothetical protein
VGKGEEEIQPDRGIRRSSGQSATETQRSKMEEPSPRAQAIALQMQLPMFCVNGATAAQGPLPSVRAVSGGSPAAGSPRRMKRIEEPRLW